MSLTVPELADRVERLRPVVLRAQQREFPRLPAEGLEDAYSQAVEGILRSNRAFEEEAQLAAYLHRAVANLARNQIRDAAPLRPLEHGLNGQEFPDDTVLAPEDRLLAAQARVLLSEFLAELSEQDRTIAFLKLDPAYDCSPRQIARELQLPYQEVHRSLRRTWVSLSRFQALLSRPGAFCQRRRPDVIEWQRTGVVPLALRIHLTRCASCRARHHAARGAVRHAILPMLPTSAPPLVGAGGALSRVWHAAGAHPLPRRVDDSLSRWRKIAPVGGGGGAAIAVKLATAATVATIGAATAALHAITTHPPTRPHRTAHARHHVAIHRLTHTPSTPAGTRSGTTVATQPVTGSATHTTAARTTTTTTARAAVPPPPNANPLPTHSTRSSRSRQIKTARATATGSTTSTASQTSTSTAYVPAPNQNPATSPTGSSGAGNSGATSSGPAAPGGPPAP